MTKQELKQILTGAANLMKQENDKKAFMTKLTKALAAEGVKYNDVFNVKFEMDPFDPVYNFVSVVEDVLFRAHQRAHQAKTSRGTRPLTLNETRIHNEIWFNMNTVMK